MSVIFTDTNCELSYKHIDEYGIKLIQMPYTLEGEEYFYDDGRDPSFTKIYQKMRDGVTPTTSALSPQNYIDYFEPVLKNGDDILYIAFSDKLSATFNYMQMAVDELKQKYPDRKITRFNTLNISFGGGIQVLEAVRLQRQGLSDEEIVVELEKFREKVGIYFYVDSLTYLRRGGRISSTSAVFGNMLNIKPILKCEDGKIVKTQTVRGQKKALSFLVDTFLNEAQINDEYTYFIIDADAKNEAKALYDEIMQKTDNKVKIESYNIGPVVTTHCGPGTVGLIYIKR